MEGFGCALQHIALRMLQFSNIQSLPAKNQWLLARVYSDLVVIYFVKILHVTCSTLKLVMYSRNVKMALQNFLLFGYILIMHLEI